jgi:EmrB/QacA subfamily drug resistance transporter
MSFEKSAAAPVTEVKSSPKIVLFIGCLSLFFLTCIFSAVNVALPAIGLDYNADSILLAWVSTAGLLSSAAILLPMGRLSDILGIKKVFLYGMILYTVTCALSALSTSIQMLIAFRTFQGISIAMVVGNAVAMVSAAFRTGNRGRALGINAAFVYIGLAVGPLLGGVMTEHWGWKSIFILNIPMGLIVIILALLKIKGDWRGGRGEKFDVYGTLIFGAAFVALMYGFSNLPDRIGAILVPLGILGLFAFVKWENRTSSPIIDLNLLRKNKLFFFSNLAAMISYAATYAVVFIMSLYLQYIKGFSPAFAGLVLLAQPAMQAVVSPIAGRFADRADPRKISSIGMAVTCAGLIAFCFIGAGTSIAVIVGLLVVLGGSFALFATPNTTTIMSSVDPKVFGMASALINTMRQIGQMFSMGVMMIVLAVVVGPVVITPEYHDAFISSTRIAFAVFSAFCFCGIFASLARNKAPRSIPRQEKD